jgi:oxygen-dependent protoporphyrinogen oxidase
LPAPSNVRRRRHCWATIGGVVLDCIIVGGGIAGLAAAWRLRSLDIVLLESESRVGGRLYSERRGDYWLNFGGHVFEGRNSAMGYLMQQACVDASPIPGSLAGLAMNGSFLKRGRVESYPFRIPMSLRDRAAVVRAGAKIRLATVRYRRATERRRNETYLQSQQRVFEFLGDRTFSDFVGPLTGDAHALLSPTVLRCAAEMDEQSAGSGVAMYAFNWMKSTAMTFNILGGSSTLPEAMAAGLGPIVRRDSRVVEIVRADRSVRVTYLSDGAEHVAEARFAIVAVPAHKAREVLVDADPSLLSALGEIRYGPSVVTSFLTNEREPQPWDDCYAIATPKQQVNMVFNQASVHRGTELERRPGGSLMAYSMASQARTQMELSDAEIASRHGDAVNNLFPGFADLVVEAKVQRWPATSSYLFPGRAALQATLTRPQDNVFLVGDYLGWPRAETAASTGLAAGQNVLSLVTTGR